MNLRQIIKTGTSMGLAALLSCMPKQNIQPRHAQLRGGITNIDDHQILLKEKHRKGKCQERTITILYQTSEKIEDLEQPTYAKLEDKNCDWHNIQGPNEWKPLAKQAYNQICNGLCPLIKNYEEETK